MKPLKEVALVFNTEVFSDYYDHTVTFKGQVLPFPEGVRSGPNTMRRVLEVAPVVGMPTQRTVVDQSSGEVYLVALADPDWYGGEVIANKYPIVPARYTGVIKSPSEMLSSAAGLIDVRFNVSYIRRSVIEEQANYMASFDLLFSNYFTIDAGDIIQIGAKYYKAREQGREDDIGLGVVETIQLYNPLQTLSYQSRKPTDYNPTTGAFTTSSSNKLVIVEPAHYDYYYTTLGFEKLEPGDQAITVLKTAATVAVGDLFGGARVLSVYDLGDCWLAHCRRKNG